MTKDIMFLRYLLKIFVGSREIIVKVLYVMSISRVNTYNMLVTTLSRGIHKIIINTIQVTTTQFIQYVCFIFIDLKLTL